VFSPFALLVKEVTEGERTISQPVNGNSAGPSVRLNFQHVVDA
jgi:hypothetical protein